MEKYVVYILADSKILEKDGECKFKFENEEAVHKFIDENFKNSGISQQDIITIKIGGSDSQLTYRICIVDGESPAEFHPTELEEIRLLRFWDDYDFMLNINKFLTGQSYVEQYDLKKQKKHIATLSVEEMAEIIRNERTE